MKTKRVIKYPEQGACMKRAREAKGLTRFELAYRSGICLNTLENLENGVYSGTIATIRILAKKLKISIDEYVGNN